VYRAYNIFLKENGFLYVNGIEEDELGGIIWVLSECVGCEGGDYFNAEDFDPHMSECDSLEQSSAYKELQALRAFKDVIDSLYGIGLEVKGWHQNGNLESFDKFYEAAIDAMEEVENE